MTRCLFKLLRGNSKSCWCRTAQVLPTWFNFLSASPPDTQGGLEHLGYNVPQRESHLCQNQTVWTGFIEKESPKWGAVRVESWATHDQTSVFCWNLVMLAGQRQNKTRVLNENYKVLIDLLANDSLGGCSVLVFCPGMNTCNASSLIIYWLIPFLSQITWILVLLLRKMRR